MLHHLLIPVSAAMENAASPVEVRRALGSVLEREEYQSSLPGGEGWVGPRSDSNWLEWLLDKLGISLASERILVFLLVALSAVALIIVLAFLVREIRDRGSTLRRGGSEGPGSAGGGAAPSLTEVRRLAGEGRFGDAIHALLLVAQDLICRRSRSAVSPSLTSREILHFRWLPEVAEEELESMVLAVEISRFGGADVNGPDFERCLRHYEQFAAALETANHA